MKFLVSSTLGLSIIPNIYGLATRDSKSGCNIALPPDVFPDKSVNLTLASSGSVSPRKFRLHLPAGYDGTQQLPVILSFHGRTQDALYQENLSQFSNASYGFSGIAVYPEGVPLIKVSLFLNILDPKDSNTIEERQTNSTMARRPRLTPICERRSVHPRTHRLSPSHILRRPVPHLRDR
jgi:hypothetical protein